MTDYACPCGHRVSTHVAISDPAIIGGCGDCDCQVEYGAVPSMTVIRLDGEALQVLAHMFRRYRIPDLEVAIDSEPLLPTADNVLRLRTNGSAWSPPMYDTATIRTEPLYDEEES